MANQLSLIVDTVSPTIKEHGADLYMWHKSELSKNTKKWAKCIPSKSISLHKLTAIFFRETAQNSPLCSECIKTFDTEEVNIVLK